MTIDKIMEYTQERLAGAGYTLKVDWLDGDPASGVNGFRIMRAEKLFEKALTIQIFDRSTVTLGWGFSNDQNVTLTKEDGRLFLEWLKTKELTPLIPEIWNVIPEAKPTTETRAAATNMAKARLVDYLVLSHPDIFGKYGAIDHATPGQQIKPGEDFYTELLKLIADPERDGRDARRLIQALDSMAANLYRRTNDYLRTEAAALKWRAIASVLAAEEIREMAQMARRNIANPPPAPNYPNEVKSHVLYAQMLAQQDTPATPQDLRYPKLKPGDMVVINPGDNIPCSGHIGEVFAADNAFVKVAFKNGEKLTYEIANVQPWPSPSR
jgi:hypothetical protein